MTEELIEQVSEEEDANLQGEGNSTEAEETTTPQGLTEEHIRAIMREEREMTAKQIAAETAKAFRAMQSMSDKKSAQIKGMAKQQIEVMKRTGAQITPDMEENYVNMFVNDYKDSLNDDAPESAQTQTQQESEANPLLDMAIVTLQRTATKLGVKIDESDNKVLDALWKNVNNPKAYQDFLDKAEAHFEAKAKTGKTPPPARMPSLPGSGSGSQATPRESLLAELQSLVEHPNPKNIKRMDEIQEKLKKL